MAESTASTCANCQAALKATARFCVGCGHRVGYPVEITVAAASDETALGMTAMVAATEVVPTAVTEPHGPVASGMPPLPSEAAAEPAWSPPVIPVRSQSLQPNEGSAKKRGPLLIVGGVVIAALLLGGGVIALTKDKSSSRSTATVASADSTVALDPFASPKTDAPAAADTQLSFETKKPYPTEATSPAKAQVPDVIGSSEPGAKSALINLGLTPQINYDYSATTPKGYVVRQNPPAGRPLSAGRVVELVISEGVAPQAPVETTQSSSSLDAEAQDPRGMTSEQAVRQYYQLLNSGEYSTTYSWHLSSSMPWTYDRYVRFYTERVWRSDVNQISCVGAPIVTCEAQIDFRVKNSTFNVSKEQVVIGLVKNADQWRIASYKVLSTAKG